MDSDLYDHIIVGAGSSGCVLANRLSANASCRVLLVEAGARDVSPWIHIPGGIFKLINNPAFDWCFQTQPEEGLKGRVMPWPRGKVLGGSSSINGLIYIRGQAEDYDHWCQLGNRGWSYADVLPYFRRSEDQGRGADAFHGAGGPLAVSDPAVRLEIVDAFVEAARQAGLPATDDFNGSRQDGAGYYQLTARGGRRCSAAAAYLKPARRRPNLRILTGALVRRVLVEDGRAVGVEIADGRDRTVVARCSGEVILSAGAIGSPHILMLSGIGDPERLRAAGVEPVHALPGVGRNLQDHFQVKMILKIRRPITLNDRVRTPLHRLLVGADYALRRQGPLSFGASLAGAFARTRPGLGSPDVQFHFQPLSLDRYDGSLHPFSAVTLSVCQLRPESRGEIVLQSPDPVRPPLIRANYLQAREDQETLVRGLRLSRRIAAAPALAEHVAEEWKPGRAADSDDDLLDYVRSIGSTVFHPAGTCRMGREADAVVDDALRVRGLQGLRVIDCSIMPTIVSGNTNAPAIMIGEKGADLVTGRAAAA